MLLLLLLLIFQSTSKQRPEEFRAYHSGPFTWCDVFPETWEARKVIWEFVLYEVEHVHTHTRKTQKHAHARTNKPTCMHAQRERKASFLKCIFIYVYVRILKSDLIIWPVIYMGPFSREQLAMTPAHFRSSNDNSCVRCHRPAGQWRLLALTPGGHQKAFGNRMHWQWTITVCLCFTLVAGIPLTFSGWESTFSEGFYYPSLFVFRCMASQRSRLGIECSDLWRRLR